MLQDFLLLWILLVICLLRDGNRYGVCDPLAQAITTCCPPANHRDRTDADPHSRSVAPCSGRPVRGPGVVAGTFLGALGGFLLAYQSSSGRLMGYLPNESECAKAGIDYAPADGAPAN